MEKVGTPDPVQKALRDHKKNWNAASKAFMKQLKALRNVLNGRGDSNFSLPPSNIKDPLPSEVGSFLSQLSSNYELLVSEALRIQQEQESFSKTRRKSQKELGAPAVPTVAATAFNLIKVAMKKNTATLRVGDQEFETLLAISEEEQATGLMHVQAPTPIMSFVYATPRVNMFWMKNTPAPLDIVFALNGNVVAIHEGEPHSTKMIGDYRPTDLVVELPRGSCDKIGLRVGDCISIVL